MPLRIRRLHLGGRAIKVSPQRLAPFLSVVSRTRAKQTAHTLSEMECRFVVAHRKKSGSLFSAESSEEEEKNVAHFSPHFMCKLQFFPCPRRGNRPDYKQATLFFASRFPTFASKFSTRAFTCLHTGKPTRNRRIPACNQVFFPCFLPWFSHHFS